MSPSGHTNSQFRDRPFVSFGSDNINIINLKIYFEIHFVVILWVFSPDVLWLGHIPHSVCLDPISSLSTYMLLCRGHSWRVRLAKQETLTPPGHRVSSRVSRGKWVPTMVLYSLWGSYNILVSVPLYFSIHHPCRFYSDSVLCKFYFSYNTCFWFDQG